MNEKTASNYQQPTANERELVREILRGERLAFERFYRRYRQELLGFVVKRVGESDKAEEIAQDTFLGFLDSLPLFSFRSSLKTFLYSIARHEVADHWRRAYAKRVLKLVPMVGEYVAKELYSTEELSQKIDYVYKRLGSEYARILQMKYEEGMSVQVMAKKLKMTVKAVESKLWRARKAFQVAYVAISE